MYLSYSGYKKYEGCPRSYWHGYIDKTPLAKPENRVNSIYGSTVGLLFEAFYAAHIWTKPGVEARLVAMAEETLDQTIERESKSGVIDFTDKAANYKSREALLKDVLETIPRGIAIIRHHRLLGTDAAAEVKLDSDIGGHRIGGRADFVMTRIKPNNDRIILDGKGSRHRDKYVDPWQLKWYAMLWRERRSSIPDALGFVFWRYEPNLAVDWVPYTEADLDELRETVVSAAGRIEDAKTQLEALSAAERLPVLQETFPTKPSRDCKLCSYLSLCTEGRAYQQAALPAAFLADAGVEDIGLLERARDALR